MLGTEVPELRAWLWPHQNKDIVIMIMTIMSTIIIIMLNDEEDEDGNNDSRSDRTHKY